MKKKIKTLGFIVVLATTVLTACDSDNTVLEENKAKYSNSSNQLLSVSSGPIFGIRIRIRIPEFKWDTPRSGCKRGFGMCDPDKHQPKQLAVISGIQDENIEGDFDLTLTSSTKMKITFLNTLQEMGETAQTTTFTIDYDDDLFINQEMCGIFEANQIIVQPGVYQLYYENGKLNADLNIIIN